MASNKKMAVSFVQFPAAKCRNELTATLLTIIQAMG